jgi:putative Mg2+ transporter-C (MgtC) family protein
MSDWYTIFLDFGKLLLAAFIGGAIGFERESHGQAAGFRTYLIVSAGACLMMLLSLHMEELFRLLDVNKSVVRLDPGRIASYAIASMGFLGAGAIIKGKGTVRGITTAAGLWVVTGMGLAIGAGYIYQTIFVTVVILVALYWLQPIRKLAKRRYYRILTVMYKGEKEPIDDIKNIIARFTSFYIQNVNYEHDLLTQTTTYRIRLYSKGEGLWKEVLKAIKPIEGTLLLRWEESDVP